MPAIGYSTEWPKNLSSSSFYSWERVAGGKKVKLDGDEWNIGNEEEV